MYSYYPLFFPFVVGVLIFFQIRLRYQNNKNKDSSKDLLKREAAANNIRKKELPSEYFFKAKLDGLPFDENTEDLKLKKLEETVIKKSELPMLRFEKKFSNLEIKEIFGANNLEKVIMYEEHFNMFVQSLNNWAEELINLDRTNNAEKILIYAADIGSDYSKTYKLLSDIYKGSKNSVKLNLLAEKIKNEVRLNNSLMKSKILKYTEN